LWYCSQSECKTFSYAEDWCGFNVPSCVIEECYTINKEYKKVMTDYIANIDQHIIEPLFIGLTKMGYDSNVHIDEAQAYLSTGLRDSHETEPLLALSDKFNKIFKSFLVDWVKPEPIIKGI